MPFETERAGQRCRTGLVRVDTNFLWMKRHIRLAFAKCAAIAMAYV
jgi:hypothetical protein